MSKQKRLAPPPAAVRALASSHLELHADGARHVKAEEDGPHKVIVHLGGERAGRAAAARYENRRASALAAPRCLGRGTARRGRQQLSLARTPLDPQETVSFPSTPPPTAPPLHAPAISPRNAQDCLRVLWLGGKGRVWGGRARAACRKREKKRGGAHGRRIGATQPPCETPAGCARTPPNAPPRSPHYPPRYTLTGHISSKSPFFIRDLVPPRSPLALPASEKRKQRAPRPTRSPPHWRPSLPPRHQ